WPFGGGAKARRRSWSRLLSFAWPGGADREVVEAADAGADAVKVRAVDVQGDGGTVAEVADAVDVAGRGEAADRAGRVRVAAGLDQRGAVVGERVEVLVLHADEAAEHAPGDVVMDAG